LVEHELFDRLWRASARRSGAFLQNAAGESGTFTVDMQLGGSMP